MNKMIYFFISGSIFAVFAAAHLIRIVKQLPIMIGAWSAPMAGSWIALIVAGLLSYCAFSLMCKEKRK